MRLIPELLEKLRQNTGSIPWLTPISKRFLTSGKGNVAMMFGLMFLPMMAAVGAAFDYARVARAENILANALDAAILAVGKQLPLTEPEVLVVANNYMKLNLANQNVFSNLTTVEVLSLDNKFVELKATNSLPTTIMQLFNEDLSQIEVSAEVNKSFPGLEVVMVLDNTGSMSGQKLVDLKSAATSMVNDLFGNAGVASHLRIALVPFADYVNIKATTPDYLGNVPNFNVNSAIDPLDVDPLLPKSSQDTYIATHYTGTAWNWMDVTESL